MQNTYLEPEYDGLDGFLQPTSIVSVKDYYCAGNPGIIDQVKNFKELSPQIVEATSSNNNLVKLKKVLLTIENEGKDQKVTVQANHEYVKGETLGFLLETIGVRDKIRLQIPAIIMDVCKAVRSLHEYQIAHRDIKPDNILLVEDPSGSIYLEGKNYKAMVFDYDLCAVVGTNKRFGYTYEYSKIDMFVNPGNCADYTVSLQEDLASIGFLLFDLMFNYYTELRYENITYEDMYEFQGNYKSVSETFLAKLKGINPSAEKFVRRATSLNPNEQYYDINELTNDFYSLFFAKL